MLTNLLILSLFHALILLEGKWQLICSRSNKRWKNPARIESLTKAQSEINKTIKKAGEDATFDSNVKGYLLIITIVVD